jgi:mRNA interferase RelE/StbE
MNYTIQYKRSASEELLALPETQARKILSSINRLAEEPRPHGSKKLKGSNNVYRLRIGNYRVIYTITDQILIVTIIKIGHRKSVYRNH